MLYTHFNTSLEKGNVGQVLFIHTMIYNVTNIKPIYLIFLKEILSVDIQIVYIGFRG